MTNRRSDEPEALTAANDTSTLIRLAADSAELVRERVHGETYERVDELFRALVDLYRQAGEVEEEVSSYITERAHSDSSGPR